MRLVSMPLSHILHALAAHCRLPEKEIVAYPQFSSNYRPVTSI